MYILQTKWSVSKDKDTYDYNICSLWDCSSGKKICSCIGGGYDMIGTCLGIFIKQNFMDEIKLWDDEKIKEHYGITRNDSNFYVDGACGKDCMLKIIKSLGFDYKNTSLDKFWDNQLFVITK